MKTYAIIEAGGQQLQVEPGRFYDIRHLVTPFSLENSLEKNGNENNNKLLLYRVLMISHKSATILGSPWIADAIIKGRILYNYRDEKVIVYKMKPKKKTRRKRGHRQDLTRFIVDGIYLNGTNLVNT